MTECENLGKFKCDNFICVLEEKVCDEVDDCGDGSDESPEFCTGEWHNNGHFFFEEGKNDFLIGAKTF